MVTPSPPEAVNPPERPTVLCVDDDPLVLHFYRGFLEPHGYRVLTAREGMEALGLARRDRPSLVLLDVMLRGLSGFDICRKFRADPTLHDLPIILITVWNHPSVETTGRDAGATLTLAKPAEAETILTAIAQVLPERGGGGNAAAFSHRTHRP